MSIICHHRRSKAQNIVIHGQLLGGQLHTHPLILPDVDADSPRAALRNSFNLAQTRDFSFIGVCKHAVKEEIAIIEAAEHQELDDALQSVPDKLRGINI